MVKHRPVTAANAGSTPVNPPNSILDLGLRIADFLINPQSKIHNPQSKWGCSIAANAPDCLSGNRGFESRHSRQTFTVGWLRKMSIGLKSRKGWCDTNSNHHFDLGCAECGCADFKSAFRNPNSKII